MPSHLLEKEEALRSQRITDPSLLIWNEGIVSHGHLIPGHLRTGEGSILRTVFGRSSRRDGVLYFAELCVKMAGDIALHFLRVPELAGRVCSILSKLSQVSTSVCIYMRKIT